MANILINNWWGPGDDKWLRHYPTFSDAIIAFHPKPFSTPEFCGLWINSADYFFEVHNSFVWGEKDGRLGLLRSTHREGKSIHQLLLCEDVSDILEHVPSPLQPRVRDLALRFRGSVLESLFRQGKLNMEPSIVLEYGGRI